MNSLENFFSVWTERQNFQNIEAFLRNPQVSQIIVQNQTVRGSCLCFLPPVADYSALSVTNQLSAKRSVKMVTPFNFFQVN